MIIKRLKIGQKVWIMCEFAIQETIQYIDLIKNEVWLSNGHPYEPNELYSSEQKCKKLGNYIPIPPKK
jgi:hypothetical protein